MEKSLAQETEIGGELFSNCCGILHFLKPSLPGVFVAPLRLLADFLHAWIVEKDAAELEGKVGFVCNILPGLGLGEEFPLPGHGFGHAQEFQEQGETWLPLEAVPPDWFGDPAEEFLFRA
jgi:hypothetical protein